MKVRAGFADRHLHICLRFRRQAAGWHTRQKFQASACLRVSEASVREVIRFLYRLTVLLSVHISAAIDTCHIALVLDGTCRK